MPVGYATTHKALGGQDHLLFEIDTDARHRHWLVCQPLCLWTGSVKMAISTFETLPTSYHPDRPWSSTRPAAGAAPRVTAHAPPSGGARAYCSYPLLWWRRSCQG